MCGICGIFHYQSGKPVEKEIVEKMTRVMLHRGPDEEGYYHKGPIGMGMRRLSIIDLKGGHQPIHNEDSTIWIVFNGEIYNFQELRRELEDKGHLFYTRSDTEVIVHSYEEWGYDCLNYLNGIFGFSIWDERNQTLFLARDHFGVKPVYYFDEGGSLRWGSEIKAILEDLYVPREVDLQALDLYLNFRFVPSPYTLFKGIKKLPPGHRLISHPEKGIQVERYWYPRPHISDTLSEKDYIQELRECLMSAIRRQMISDVPIGALLSGGVDSAVVVGIMSRLTDRPVLTFTVGFRGASDINELNDARETAELFKTEHYEVVLSSLDYQELLQKAVWHLDEPIASPAALPTFLVCQLARQHVKVCLTGQGADEPHGGYFRYLGERYGGYYRAIPEGIRDHFLKPIIEALPRRERMKRGVKSMGTLNVAERFVHEYAVFNQEMRSGLWRTEYRPASTENLACEIVNYWRQDVDYLDPMEQMSYVDARLLLADDLLLYGDKMSMATSVEKRVPFLDLDYMSLAETLPASLRIHGLQRKYIHKKVISEWVPPKIINRPKRGFETPVDHWFRSELTGFVKERLLSPESACRIYFNPSYLEGMLKDHIQGRQDFRRHLYSLLVFELWHRQFISRAN